MENHEKKGAGKSRSKRPEPAAKVRQMTIDADQAGQRLDNYLQNLATGVPRSRIYRAIRSGEVRINKGRTRAQYRLQDGDVVRVPPLRVMERVKVEASSASQASILESIIDRHKHYLVLNKPSGWAVHGGSGISMGIIETLRQALPGDSYLELAHRLDRSTSGCLIIARRRSFLRALHEQIREDEVKKTYLLLVKGQWDKGRHRCEVPLQTQNRHNGERYVVAHPEGKYCRTDFRPIEFFSGATLLEAVLHTGRTHQIRAHCAYLDHPVLGDDRYGDEDANERFAKFGLSRLFLHASSYAFEYPQGNPVQYGAPLSAELSKLLETLHDNRGANRKTDG